MPALISFQLFDSYTKYKLASIPELVVKHIYYYKIFQKLIQHSLFSIVCCTELTLTKCFSAESSSIPAGLHVSKLHIKIKTTKNSKYCCSETEHLCDKYTLWTYTWGMVVLKISSIQLHVWPQTSGLNFCPFSITRFSRQFVPDRANCSFSVEDMFHIY